MKNASLQKYTKRISQANKSELIVILYEIILENLDDAYYYYENNDLDNFVLTVKYSQKFLNELIISLDFSYSISYQLVTLYRYCNKMMIKAWISRKVSPLDIVKSIIGKLLVAFKEISRQDNSKAMMENVAKVYAGLTYGKGTLNEMYTDVTNINRGFRV